MTNRAIKATILAVDDEPAYLAMIRSVLTDAGYEVLTAASASQALEIFSRRQVDLAILDLIMPEIDGRELMRRLKAKLPELPIIFLTAHGSIPSAVEAIKEGATDYLTKPLPHIDDLLQTILRVLELTELKKQKGIQQKKHKEPFPCASPVMKKVLAMADKVAKTDVTVLITGESGTGKERMAQYIHLNSKVADNEMIAVNCAAIVDTLLESELFGHEKGAFTGANERKPGRFEEAGNSTLFLDEIGEMTLALQPKLLRALQEKEFRRVGGSQLIRMNSRLIVATNRDLKEQCQVGKFREDLYYRISVFTLNIPPLRERFEDIGFLARRFVEEAAQRFGKSTPGIGKEFMKALIAYEWPGNVRELANVIEASTLLCDGSVLQLKHLHGIDLAGKTKETEEPLAQAEKDALIEALQKFAGNRQQTADYLGMSKRNLIYKLKKHDLLKRTTGL
jgi:two-component system response regulator HydG